MGYISELGADVVLLNSFYLSHDYDTNPGQNPDKGYEILDHTEVDPMFGSMEDFEALLEEAHDMGKDEDMNLIK